MIAAALALAGLLAAAAAAPAVAADEPKMVVYKQVTADGRVIYTDEPDAAATTQKKLLVEAPRGEPMVITGGVRSPSSLRPAGTGTAAAARPAAPLSGR